MGRQQTGPGRPMHPDLTTRGRSTGLGPWAEGVLLGVRTSVVTAVPADLGGKRRCSAAMVV